MFGYSRAEKGDFDLESGGLYPGISLGDSVLRWAFIRKVYGILAAQIVLTTIVSAVTVLYSPVNDLLRGSPGLVLAFAVLQLVLLFPLYHYQQRHPLNLFLLGIFTLCLSVTVGVACANTQGKIVLQALVITSGVVLSLTGYTFWAAKKGKDFSFLGPALFASLLVLVLTSFIQIFFPFGSTGTAIFGAIGALIFSAYIIYDTDNLIKRFTYDQYIWASVTLYLDIINLFLFIMDLLRGMQSDG
ncbi:bax inhibitor-1 family protein [Wolffia australiana]